MPTRGATLNGRSSANKGIFIENYDHTFNVMQGSGLTRIPALRRISLSVEESQFVTIVGPSGCGKTTLLNVLAGLQVKQATGTVDVGGQPPKSGRDDIAYMFARPALLPWRSTLDNVALAMELRGVPTKERYRIAHEMLSDVGLADFAKAYPSQLSQGMRQRAALARTFALNTRFLLMDEPFGALDAQTKLVLEQQLLSLWESRRNTVVFVTHDLAEAITLSDRVVVMSGRPGAILVDVPIQIDRPRVVEDLQSEPLFHDLYRTLWVWLANNQSEIDRDERSTP